MTQILGSKCPTDFVLTGTTCTAIYDTKPDPVATPFQSLITKDNKIYHIICSIEQFNTISNHSEFLDQNYILKADLAFNPALLNLNFCNEVLKFVAQAAVDQLKRKKGIQDKNRITY